jgi:hypothetical protein
MRTFFLLIGVDVAIVALGIALFAGPSSQTAGETSEEAARSVAESRRLLEEARALRSRTDRLEARLAVLEGRPAPAPGTAGTASTAPAFPEGDLDRLEAALRAVEERRARERAREGLRTAVRHVYPDLSEDQQRGVAEAIGAYREILEASLLPGGEGALAGHEAGKAELRRRLEGVVPPARADEIVLRYAIRPGPPAGSPAVSPPIQRR